MCFYLRLTGWNRAKLIASFSEWSAKTWLTWGASLLTFRVQSPPAFQVCFCTHKIHFTIYPTPLPCMSHVSPAAWLNLLKKMWSEVSPAWFHWSSEVLWKGKLTTVHLQNLLVPACWAAWAGDNLEAAGVSGKLWRQAFLGFFLLLLGLLFSGFCSDPMQSCKRKPTRKQKPKQPWQNKVYANPHRSWGGWCRTVGMMWTPLWTLCLLELSCCSFGSCLKPWGLWGRCFPRVMIAGFIFFLGAQVYSGAENLSLVWMRRFEAIPNRRGQTFHCVQNAFPDLWVPLEIVAIRLILHEHVQNRFIVLLCLNLGITAWWLFPVEVWCEEREELSCCAGYCLCSTLVPYLKLRQWENEKNGKMRWQTAAYVPLALRWWGGRQLVTIKINLHKPSGPQCIFWHAQNPIGKRWCW